MTKNIKNLEKKNTPKNWKKEKEKENYTYIGETKSPKVRIFPRKKKKKKLI